MKKYKKIKTHFFDDLKFIEIGTAVENGTTVVLLISYDGIQYSTNKNYSEIYIYYPTPITTEPYYPSSTYTGFRLKPKKYDIVAFRTLKNINFLSDSDFRNVIRQIPTQDIVGRYKQFTNFTDFTDEISNMFHLIKQHNK